MDALELARLQFAFTIMFHFIIVPYSLGLAVIAIVDARRYYKSGLEQDKLASAFWLKILAVFFAIGVATGIPMEFAFGTNWGEFSRMSGDVMGVPVAAENFFAFFLESTFLGVVLFGRDRVSPRVYYISVWLVAIGAVLSATWIIVANSLQHTPAGFRLEDGKMVITDFWAAVFNPSTLPRFTHTLMSTWAAGAFAAAAIGAYYLLRGRHVAFARRALTVGLLVGLLTSLAMPLLGHWHAVEVADNQPVKLAAFEGLYRTERGARLTLIGWTDPDTQTTTALAVPDLLSLLLDFDANGEVAGLDQAPRADWPNVNVVFQSYHAMIGIGVLMILVTAGALFFLWRRSLEQHRWMLWLLVAAAPLPMLAIQAGWVTTEMGRQPWIVQGIMRTADGVSREVSRTEVATSLVVFAVFYAVLFVLLVRVLGGLIRSGPQETSEAGQTTQQQPEQAPGGGAA